MPRQPSKPTVAKLDRFLTHKHFLTLLPELSRRMARKSEARNAGRKQAGKRSAGSCAAGLALMIAWDMADGRTGLVRAFSIAHLAKTMGVARSTAAAALAVLLEPIGDTGPLLVEKEAGSKNGKRAPVYHLLHLEKADV